MRVRQLITAGLALFLALSIAACSRPSTDWGGISRGVGHVLNDKESTNET